MMPSIVTPEDAQRLVDAWRAKHPEIVSFWQALDPVISRDYPKPRARRRRPPA